MVVTLGELAVRLGCELHGDHTKKQRKNAGTKDLE